MRAMAAALLVVVLVLAAGAQDGGRVGPGGEPAKIDLLSARLTFRNVGSARDGKGMCVFTAVEYLFRWHGLDEWRGFRDWCAARYPGGGWPAKLEELLAAYASAHGLPDPRGYVLQVQGDTGPILDWAQRTRRPVAITDCGNPRDYGGRPVAHMTTMVHRGPHYCAIIDNNFPEREDWVSAGEFERRHRWRNYAWAVVVLAPPPPPIPRNRVLAEGGAVVPFMLGVMLQAGCAGGQCGPALVAAADDGWRWEWDQRYGQFNLLDRRGGQAGAYRPETKKFWWKRGNGWLEGQAPLALPQVAAPAQPAKPDAEADRVADLLADPGLVQDRLLQVPPQEAIYRLGGRDERLPPQGPLGADPREDDSRRVHVVVTHPSAAEGQRIAAELRRHPEWPRLQERVFVHVRDPQHWHVADVGIGGAGRQPGVTVLGAAGERDDQAEEFGWLPLGDRVFAAADVEEVVDATIEAVRQAHGGYTPTVRPRRDGGGAELVVLLLAGAGLFVVVAGLGVLAAIIIWSMSHPPRAD